jgi:hypothetical protein
MVAISYFFYKLFLIDFIVSSVYTKQVMPPKRARVSRMRNCKYYAIYAIYGTIWQQWQCHSDDGVISDVENDLDCLNGETVVYLFIWYRNASL